MLKCTPPRPQVAVVNDTKEARHEIAQPIRRMASPLRFSQKNVDRLTMWLGGTLSVLAAALATEVSIMLVIQQGIPHQEFSTIRRIGHEPDGLSRCKVARPVMSGK
ncbi:hypothetical protein OKW43_005798 [Paraburkholderia sp. WC7.3g]|uniref:hypothetical protein n=1 Tax=Paraburkholderia sp. WC7.3g TaxID=2991070 RepID=UPI003D1D88A7